MLTKRLSRRHQVVTITGLSYADDTAINTNQIERAQEFLTSIKIEIEKIGLQLNSNKREVMVINHSILVSIYSQEHNTVLNSCRQL